MRFELKRRLVFEFCKKNIGSYTLISDDFLSITGFLQTSSPSSLMLIGVVALFEACPSSVIRTLHRRWFLMIRSYQVPTQNTFRYGFFANRTREINGVEGMLYMSLDLFSDGSYNACNVRSRDEFGRLQYRWFKPCVGCACQNFLRKFSGKVSHRKSNRRILCWRFH